MNEIFGTCVLRDSSYNKYSCIISPDDAEVSVLCMSTWQRHLDYAKENGLLIVAYLYFDYLATPFCLKAVYTSGQCYSFEVHSETFANIMRSKYVRLDPKGNPTYVNYEPF